MSDDPQAPLRTAPHAPRPAPTVHVFIISWPGQHARALAIHDALAASCPLMSIVYSDASDDAVFPAQVRAVRRPNELYFGDKFKACLDLCQSDLLFLIHADCDCDDWPGLVARGVQDMQAHPRMGVWSPLIDGTPHSVDRTRIGELGRAGLVIVAGTDAIVLAIPRAVLKRMAAFDYAANKFGWGIDRAILAHVYSTGGFAAVNLTVRVKHPPSRGYPAEQAREQEVAFLRALTPAERVQHTLLTSHVTLRRALAVARQAGPDGADPAKPWPDVP